MVETLVAGHVIPLRNFLSCFDGRHVEQWDVEVDRVEGIRRLVEQERLKMCPNSVSDSSREEIAVTNNIVQKSLLTLKDEDLHDLGLVVDLDTRDEFGLVDGVDHLNTDQDQCGQRF